MDLWVGHIGRCTADKESLLVAAAGTTDLSPRHGCVKIEYVTFVE